MTRTVADAALMLAAMAGPDEWDRTSLEGVPQDYVGSLGRGIEGLRVAFSPDLGGLPVDAEVATVVGDRKSTRLNSSHSQISYAVFCLKKKKNKRKSRYS